MGYDSSIRKRIRQLAKSEKDKLKESDVYESRELLSYLEGLSVSMKGENGRSTAIHVFNGERDGPIAWTSGKSMSINWNSGIIWYYPTPEQRFVAFLGLFFHETAHDLFTDFNEEKRALSFIQKGSFCGDAPVNLTPQEDADWADMLLSMSNPAARMIFTEVFHNLTNIVDDVHDENALIDVYGSFVGEGICVCQSSLHATCPLFEDQKTQLLQGAGSELQLAYNLLLQQARFGYVLCKDESVLKHSQFGPMLEKIKNHSEIACATDDVIRRFSELNYIMLALWPFIRSQIQNMQNQQGSGQGQGQGQNGQDPGQNQNSGTDQGQGQQSGNSQNPQNGDASQSGGQKGRPSGSQLTQEQAQKIIEQLQKAAQNAGQTQAPENKSSSEKAIERRAAERKGEKKEDGKKAEPSGSKMTKEAIYNTLKNLQQQVAEGKAEEKAEKEAKQALVDAVCAADQTSPHVGVPLKFTRSLSVTDSDRSTYDTAMHDLLPISKRLQRQIIDALRDLKEGYVARHKIAGKMLVVNDAYRPDGRCFANKKIPQDLPDMAISVLVDHSGSMMGDRIYNAMQASMLLYDFARGIGIPISIAGHRSGDGHSVEYITYTDFDDISGKDRYRISKMSAQGNNRDGMALNIAASLLDKRPEQVKLLIIISDGRPNHTNYGGEAAAKDIQEIIRACRRKGIEVIAAAIGEDRRNIQAIYKDEFLDISDLAKLPKTMTNIVKKRVLRTAM